jgi:hypothetical protein
MGGHIRIRSRLGEGPTFIVKLPGDTGGLDGYIRGMIEPPLGSGVILPTRGLGWQGQHEHCEIIERRRPAANSGWPSYSHLYPSGGRS